MNVSSGGRRADTRARIVQSGTELFARKGVYAVTSHDIADGAGVAAGTFYLHFADKAELFREIARLAIRELRAQLASALELGATPEDTLRLQAETLLDFATERRDLVLILFGREHEAGDLLDEFSADIAKSLELNLVGSDLHAGVAGQATVGMWTRVITWWAEDPTRAPREAIVATLLACQTHGIGVPASA